MFPQSDSELPFRFPPSSIEEIIATYNELPPIPDGERMKRKINKNANKNQN
jgi:hypothetical protein